MQSGNEGDAFRTYDVRGIYSEVLTPALAYKIGRAQVISLSAKKIVVGYDMRESSGPISSEFIRGATDQGCEVILLGLCTTPTLNFVLSELGLDGGAMITASHCPKEYNGIKLMKSRSLQLYLGGGLEKIRDLAISGELSNISLAENKGEINELKARFAYIQKCKDTALEYSGFKIICDYGNGVGSITAKPFFDQSSAKVVHMYAEPDGNFPNHPANPHDLENLSDLQAAVLEIGGDIGIFFDGDGDRAYFVDEIGKIVMPDLILALLAKHELANLAEDLGDFKEKVYFDFRMSNVVSVVVSSNGGEPIVMRVGNPFYKEKLIYDGGIIAGELSGHIMFSDHYAIDDGLYAAIKVLNIMTKTGKKLSELILPFRKYFGSEEINLKVSDANSVLAAVSSAFEGAHRLDIDGVYVKYFHWCWSYFARFSRIDCDIIWFVSKGL